LTERSPWSVQLSEPKGTSGLSKWQTSSTSCRTNTGGIREAIPTRPPRAAGFGVQENNPSQNLSLAGGRGNHPLWGGSFGVRPFSPHISEIDQSFSNRITLNIVGAQPSARQIAMRRTTNTSLIAHPRVRITPIEGPLEIGSRMWRDYVYQCGTGYQILLGRAISTSPTPYC